MRKKFILLILLLIILLSLGGYALPTVNLISPSDSSISSTSTVEFKCEAFGISLISIELHGDFTGTWAKNQTKVFDPATQKQQTFTVSNLQNKDYKWTCKAVDSEDGSNFASSNRTLTVNVVNDPPIFNPNNPIPDLSWYSNEAKPNAFDLDSYFVDPDNDALTFTSNGNSNIIITINSTTHVVNLAHLATFLGEEKVYFRATDTEGNYADSNLVTFTVLQAGTQQQETENQTENQTGSNTPPSISEIPKQTKEKNADDWEINLDDYGSDNEDSKENLVWTVSDINTTLINAEIINRKLKITPVSGATGTNTLKLTVTDTGNLSYSRNVEIEIKEPETTTNEEESAGEEEFSEFTTEAVKNMESYSPEETTITMTEKENKMFRINLLNPNSQIKWSWNEEQIPGENKESYFLNYENLENNKEYTLKAEATSGANTETATWNIKTQFKEEQVETTATETKTEEEKESKSIISKITGAVVGTTSKITTKIKGSKILKIVLISIGALIVLGFALFLLLRRPSNPHAKIIKKIEKNRGYLEPAIKKESSEFKKPEPEKRFGDFEIRKGF